MKIEDLNKSKVPLFKINPNLDRFKGKKLFPEKVELANKLLNPTCNFIFTNISITII